MKRIFACVVMVVASRSARADECGDARARLKAATSALSDCVAAGGGCSKEFAEKDAAEKAVEPCPPATPEPQPLVTPQATPGPATQASPVATVTPAPATSASQVVYLKDGSVLRGQVIATRDGVVVLQTSAGTLNISQGDIARIEFGDAGNAASASVTAPAAPPVDSDDRGRSDRRLYFQLNGWVGGKFLKSSDWAPAQTQNAFGYEVDIAGSNWRVGSGTIALAIDFFGSTVTANTTDATSGDPVGYHASTEEIANGVRWIGRENSMLRPFIGLGVSEELSAFSGSDQVTGAGDHLNGFGLGGWLQAGAFVRIGRHVNVGGEYRFSSVPTTMSGISTNAGGSEVAAIVGIALGSAAGDAQ